MSTVREVISRVRNLVKAVKQDARFSDRFIYSMVMKQAKLLMRRQDSLNRIMKYNSVFLPLHYVELIEVDKAEACCKGVTSGCVIKRSKDRLPKMIEGFYGPLIRSVSSLDQSEDVHPTFPTTYEKIRKQKTFKYNSTKYYWFIDGYLYLPDLEWDAIRIEAVFEDSTSAYNCDTTDDCQFIQDRSINIPEFLFAEIDQLILRELGVSMQIPQDVQQDLRHPLSE